MEGIRSLSEQARELVVVTNEIFSDGIEYSPETVQYQAFLGQINQEIAKMAGNVTEVVYGIPLCHKNERKEGTEIMKPWWNSFKIAFSMYSKVPMPKSDWTKENMRYIMCLFPLIGVIIGAVTWAWGYWGLQITRSHLFYSVVLVLIPVVITGGIHLDGLLDTSDALHSYQPRERKLEILKDSHAGAFAIITAVVYFLFYLGVYSEMTLKALPVVCIGFVLSRAMVGFSIAAFPMAKNTGLAAPFLTEPRRPV